MKSRPLSSRVVGLWVITRKQSG